MKNTKANGNGSSSKPAVASHADLRRTTGPRDPLFHQFQPTDYRITAIRKCWRDWLALHMIDPDEVHTLGWVHRSLKYYTVTYEAMVIDYQSKNKHGAHTTRYKTIIVNNQSTIATTVKSVQLESTPVIFPYQPIDRIIRERRTLEDEETHHDNDN